MGCINSKQTGDGSKFPNSIPGKHSSKKKTNRYSDHSRDENTNIPFSNLNSNKTEMKYKSNAVGKEADECLECYTESPRRTTNNTNTDISNSDKAEDSNRELHTEAQEKNSPSNTDFPDIKGGTQSSENTTEADSRSVRLRKQGNETYLSVTQDLHTTIQIRRLNEAANCYCRAFEAATKEEESVSAAKNAAMAYWRIAELTNEQEITAANTIFYYKEVFKFFSFAYNNGILCDTIASRTKLCSSIDTCWLDFTKSTNKHFDLEDRIDLYYNILQVVEIDHIRGNFYLNLARFHFRYGVAAIQNGQYQRGLSEMSNCSMPIHEARKRCLDAYNVGLECDSLEDDVLMHTCTADAMQAIDVGDKLFDQATKEDEKINMDMVWDVVDWYKGAVLRTRERTEMEQEAIAASRLGKIYDKVLKMKDKAKKYVMRSIQLAHSMHPRTFTSKAWFKEASEILKTYQDETQTKEDAQWNEEREDIKKEMKDQLDKLEKADKKGDLELLHYVYKKFPPKNPLHKDLFELQKDTDKYKCNTKKLYQKAVVNYHPDRANVEDNGVHWKVMTEEITKLLNCRYNRMKGQ